MKENELIGCYVHVCRNGLAIKTFKVLGLVGTDSYLLKVIAMKNRYCIVRDVEWLKTKTITHPNEITDLGMIDELIANVGEYDEIFKTL